VNLIDYHRPGGFRGLIGRRRDGPGDEQAEVHGQ